MNTNITSLKPDAIWFYFNEITKIPRPSKKEEKILDYLHDFAREHNLDVKQDNAGNMLITKEATPGMEHLPVVVLQSHVDMVCEKNSDVEFNFDTDAIQTYIDGDWVRAKGTTLGADNGIGVAAELAILAADDISHGKLECLFTVDEETGLTGAFALEEDFFTGKILINLDSEDEGELFIGCAGGIDTTIRFPYEEEAAPPDLYFFRLDVKGLTGGHSGGDIHKGLANANKLLAGFLYRISEETGLYISEIDGGNLRNAIPREAYVVAAVPFSFKERLRVLLNLFVADTEERYKGIEKNIQFILETSPVQEGVIEPIVAGSLVVGMNECPNGVIAMSKDIEGLVETSTNLASVKMDIENKVITVITSQRSAIESEKRAIAQQVEDVFVKEGAKVTHGEGYPGWQPNLNSDILKVSKEAYKRLFNKEPEIKAIHAGLECGLFLQKYPDLDMVSFGPTLQNVHSPDECLQISTVPLFWAHLLEVLKSV